MSFEREKLKGIEKERERQRDASMAKLEWHKQISTICGNDHSCFSTKWKLGCDQSCNKKWN